MQRRVSAHALIGARRTHREAAQTERAGARRCGEGHREATLGGTPPPCERVGQLAPPQSRRIVSAGRRTSPRQVVQPKPVLRRPPPDGSSMQPHCLVGGNSLRLFYHVRQLGNGMGGLTRIHREAFARRIRRARKRAGRTADSRRIRIATRKFAICRWLGRRPQVAQTVAVEIDGELR